MKYVSFLFFTGIAIMQACKPVKKVQSIQAAIAKKDTVQRILVKEVPSIDSVAIVTEIMAKVMKQRINFATFNAKIKVDYEGVEESQHPTVYLSMRKDSVIFLQVVGNFLGITAKGMEVKITKDSVVVIKEFGEKWVKNRSFTYLQDVTELPVDFSTFQDLLIGNPVFISNNIASYKVANQNLMVLMLGNLFKHLITLDNTDQKVLHSKLDDVDLSRNRTCDITFANYVPAGDYQFATYRKISVAEKSKLDITLDFKQFKFNEDLKYIVNIPKNYKRL